MEKDPKQYNNLIDDSKYAEVLLSMKEKLKARLGEIGENDLGKKN